MKLLKSVLCLLFVLGIGLFVCSCEKGKDGAESLTGMWDVRYTTTVMGFTAELTQTWTITDNTITIRSKDIDNETYQYTYNNPIVKMKIGSSTSTFEVLSLTKNEMKWQEQGSMGGTLYFNRISN